MRRGKPVTWHGQEKKAGAGRSRPGPAKASRRSVSLQAGDPTRALRRGGVAATAWDRWREARGSRPCLWDTTRRVLEKNHKLPYFCVFLLPFVFLRTLHFTQYINK